MKLESGRNSTRVSIRLENKDIELFQEQAKGKGMVFGEYLRDRLHSLAERLRSNETRSVDATKKREPYDPAKHGIRAQKIVEFDRGMTDEKLSIAKAILANAEARTIPDLPADTNPPKVTPAGIPIYEPNRTYPVGSKVLVKKGKRYVEMTVPELDGDGHIVPS